MEIVVHSKKSLFQQKFHKKLYHFNRNSQFWKCDVKNGPVGHPESDSNKKIRLRLPVLLGIRLRLHSKTTDSLRVRPFCRPLFFHSSVVKHGRRKGGQGLLDFEIGVFSIAFFAKNVVFSDSRTKNKISPLVTPLEKSLWLPLEKSANAPHLKQILPTPMLSILHLSTP